MIYCNYCPGYCCYRRQGSVLLVTGEDINRLARFFKIRDGQVRKKYMGNKNTFRVKKDGSCIFQAADRMTARCSVHEARPAQCRNFPYNRPCPYLEREDLLAAIQPLVETGLRKAWSTNGCQSNPAADYSFPIGILNSP
jgi:Fe-S-cluster containining protein